MRRTGRPLALLCCLSVALTACASRGTPDTDPAAPAEGVARVASTADGDHVVPPRITFAPTMRVQRTEVVREGTIPTRPSSVRISYAVMVGTDGRAELGTLRFIGPAPAEFAQAIREMLASATFTPGTRNGVPERAEFRVGGGRR